MTWWMFYLIVSGLLTLVIVLVALPWIHRRSATERDSLTNTQIVRQRLQELEREAREGLITQEDLAQASNELKLALVEEASVEQASGSKATLAIIAGALIALVAGVVVYANVNQIGQVKRATQAIDNLPGLSAKLSSQGSEEFTAADIQDLALAIRTRLAKTPDDAKGWMYLGRLQMSLGQDQQALEALQRALEIEPDNLTARMTYAQVLMVSGDANKLRTAQRELASLIRGIPDNDNLALMMAVTSAQLGDLPNTERYYKQVADKLPPNNDMVMRLKARIAELKGQVAQAPTGSNAATTGFALTVAIDDSLKGKLPQDGFLIVFAQDALSDNRMPAAVIKMPLQSFPLSLSLSTDNAMLPNYTLAQLKSVNLVARISRDGNVAPATGELEGRVKMTVQPGMAPAVEINIDKELE